MTRAVTTGDTHKPFLTDVRALRYRARSHLETGNVTQSYKGDVTQAIAILQSVLATEIVCVLRYTMHAVAATGILSEGRKGGVRATRERRAGAHDGRRQRWFDHTAAIDAIRQSLKDAPHYDPAMPLRRDQEMDLYQHHGRAGYWTAEEKREDLEFRTTNPSLQADTHPPGSR
ncbi:MAG TPA: hypothetical protein VN734_07170 [Acidobacteriaceae bacterium]|nr:hypothetical protein [Acidobacteriaceae bacterium]